MPKTSWVLLIIAAFLQPAFADEWGTLKGTLQFDGDPAEPSRLTVNKDVEVCGQEKLFDESLAVGSDSKGLANAVIYLYLGRGDSVTPHPDFETAAAEKVRIDNIACRFEPHVVALRTSQTLVIGNKDPIGHNTKIDSAEQGINPIVPGDTEMEHKFQYEERRPVPVSCSIHPWMKGWLVLKDHPYFAVSDETGSFEISKLPVGKWEFQLWHEKAGYLKNVSTALGKASRKGRLEVEIKAGDNDLGTVSVPAALFE